jgi:hypothetical protein
MPLPATTHSRKHERPENNPVDYLVEHAEHKVCYYDGQRAMHFLGLWREPLWSAACRVPSCLFLLACAPRQAEGPAGKRARRRTECQAASRRAAIKEWAMA